MSSIGVFCDVVRVAVDAAVLVKTCPNLLRMSKIGISVMPILVSFCDMNTVKKCSYVNKELQSVF